MRARRPVTPSERSGTAMAHAQPVRSKRSAQQFGAARSHARPTWSRRRRPWSYVDARARPRHRRAGCTDRPGQQFDYLTDVTAVEYRDPERPLEVVWHLRSLPVPPPSASRRSSTRARRSKSRRSGTSTSGADWLERECLRHVRHRLHRPSRPAPHPDVGAVQGGLSAAEGLPAARPLQPGRAAAPGARGRIPRPTTPWKSFPSPRRSRSCPRTCASALARGEKGSVDMATAKRTVEVELSTTGLDAPGRAAARSARDGRGDAHRPTASIEPTSTASTC